MENSKIDWAKHTFNPWLGCTHISEGCANCFAEASESTRLKKVGWGKGEKRKKTSAENWGKPLLWEEEAKKSGDHPVVFCASAADVFDQEVSEKWRDELFELIAKCPSLKWFLLTKRSKFLARYKKRIESLPQICVGVTAENQKRFDERVPHLLKLDVPVRFVSMEPLLGPVTLGKSLKSLHWIMVGGESSSDGKSARPMHAAWVENIRDECLKAKVPFHFKQWGGKSQPERKARGKTVDGKFWHEAPQGLVCAHGTPLSAKNQDLLKKLERQVTDGVKASIAAAKALYLIREHDNGVLWKSLGYEKFGDYCAATWKYATSHSYRLADAGEFVLDLEKHSPIGEKLCLPHNESQIRPVLELPKKSRVEFWHEKIIALGPDQITTKTVSNAVDEFRAEKKIPPKPKKVFKDPTPEVLKERAVSALARLQSLVTKLPKGKEICEILAQVDDLMD